MTRGTRLVISAGIAALVHLAAPADTPATSPPVEEAVTLAVVNGDVITSGDLDALLIESHQEMSAGRREAFDYRRLLDKLINDRLILQQALAIGLDEQPEILAPIDESRAESAVQKYVASTYAGPDEITDEAVRDYFSEYYWKIQLRQISVPTREAAESLLQAVRDGAPMDSLAEAASVDSHRYRGGLHNLKPWADVENVLRSASESLAVGEVSDPFPYRESTAFVRVEERRPVDAADLEQYEGEIRKYLRGAERERAWTEFVDEHLARTPVLVDSTVIARIVAAADEILSPEFVAASDTPALSLGDMHTTEYELRKTLSHSYMRASLAPFDSLLNAAVDSEKSDLVLRSAAAAAGWFDDESVQQEYHRKLEKTLIEAYLGETIAPKITFSREEFVEYYEQHPEEFRGEAQVQLGTIMVGNREVAEEIVSRLKEGSDFNYVRDEFVNPGHGGIEEDKWVSPAIFSDEIRQEITRLEIGQSSGAFEVAGGWIVFKLKNRRVTTKTLEEADLQLRKIMFQKRFTQLLDEHLSLLKERSEIVLHEDAIGEYFGSES